MRISKPLVSRTFSGETRREIDDIMATKIALENGIIGYRLKKYYPDMTPEDIKGYMLDFWREPPMKLLDTALQCQNRGGLPQYAEKRPVHRRHR